MVGQALGLLHYLLSWRQASDPLGWEQGEGSGCQQGEETRMCFTQAKLDWQGIGDHRNGCATRGGAKISQIGSISV